MKTIADLNALIPTLVNHLRNNDHKIGRTFWDQSEDGWNLGEESEENFLDYDGDGWYIEINYEVTGEWDEAPGDYWTPGYCSLRKAWGNVTSISATHYDDETDEETIFSEEDLTDLYYALNKELEYIS